MGHLFTKNLAMASAFHPLITCIVRAGGEVFLCAVNAPSKLCNKVMQQQKNLEAEREVFLNDTVKKFRGRSSFGYRARGRDPSYFWVEGKVFGFLHLAALT